MDRFELANFGLNLLVALDALLGERSVSTAAKLTGVTPSAMSHSLAELRALLDDPLLVRSGRAMVLTPRAEALGPPLRKLLLDAKRMLVGSTTFDPTTAERRFVIAEAAPRRAASSLLHGCAARHLAIRSAVDRSQHADSIFRAPGSVASAGAPCGPADLSRRSLLA